MSPHFAHITHLSSHRLPLAAPSIQDCLNMMIIDAIWMLALSWYLAQVRIWLAWK